MSTTVITSTKRGMTLVLNDILLLRIDDCWAKDFDFSFWNKSYPFYELAQPLCRHQYHLSLQHSGKKWMNNQQEGVWTLKIKQGAYFTLVLQLMHWETNMSVESPRYSSSKQFKTWKKEQMVVITRLKFSVSFLSLSIS